MKLAFAVFIGALVLFFGLGAIVVMTGPEPKPHFECMHVHMDMYRTFELCGPEIKCMVEKEESGAYVKVCQYIPASE